MADETIFYVKKGRKYIPHSTYSSEFCDSFPKGTHLVSSYPGGSSRRFNIDPAYAPMIAAGRVAEDVISKKIMESSEIRRNLRSRTTPLTPSQHAAWENLVKEFGEDARQLEWPSARECAEEAVKAMTVEAVKLLEDPNVRKAYERFQFVCDLTREVEVQDNG
jgi:hypothetical protein